MALSAERKGTMAVSLTNFLDSGCIVASSTALTAWAAAFGFGAGWTAILGAIGANAFGAAVGALIGGFLTDKFGRTIIYRYNLLVYALGVFIAMVAVNLPMVVVGVVLSGLSVGAGVPASWSYISETSSSTRRASNIGISQFAWSCGPAIILSYWLWHCLSSCLALQLMELYFPQVPTVHLMACSQLVCCSWCFLWLLLLLGTYSVSSKSQVTGLKRTRRFLPIRNLLGQ